MKLNLGCGDQYALGWINIDYGTPHKVDQKVDLRSPLPWGEGTVDYIYAGHLFEHLTLSECTLLLKRLHFCMAKNGQIMIVGPDIELAEEMQRNGSLDVTLDSLRYGANRWEGDVHHWECTSAKLMLLLENSGWNKVTEMRISEVPDFWPVAYRGPQWQCAVTAVK